MRSERAEESTDDRRDKLDLLSECRCDGFVTCDDADEEGDCGRRECDREFREVLIPFRVRFVITSISESGVDVVLRIEKIVVTFFSG
jgi:hypothetical protein